MKVIVKKKQHQQNKPIQKQSSRYRKTRNKQISKTHNRSNNLLPISPIFIQQLSPYEQKIRQAIQYRYKKSKGKQFIYKTLIESQDQTSNDQYFYKQSQQMPEMIDFAHLKDQQYVNIHSFHRLKNKKQKNKFAMLRPNNPFINTKSDSSQIFIQPNNMSNVSHNSKQIHKIYSSSQRHHQDEFFQNNEKQISAQRQNFRFQKRYGANIKDTFKLAKYQMQIKDRKKILRFKQQKQINSQHQIYLLNQENLIKNKTGGILQKTTSQESNLQKVLKNRNRKKRNYNKISALRQVNTDLSYMTIQPHQNYNDVSFQLPMPQTTTNRNRSTLKNTRGMNNNPSRSAKLINNLMTRQYSNQYLSMSEQKFQLQEINLKYKPLETNRKYYRYYKAQNQNKFNELLRSKDKQSYSLQTAYNKLISNKNRKEQSYLLNSNKKHTIRPSKMVPPDQQLHQDIPSQNSIKHCNKRRKLRIRTQFEQKNQKISSSSEWKTKFNNIKSSRQKYIKQGIKTRLKTII